jgi:hypothetical protein
MTRLDFKAEVHWYLATATIWHLII